MTVPAATQFSADDVSKHSTKNDLWMIIHNKVYNITEFVLEVKKRNQQEILSWLSCYYYAKYNSIHFTHYYNLSLCSFFA